MNDTQRFVITTKVDTVNISEYKQYALQSARQRAGNKLFDILWQSKLPAVVDIDERIEKVPSNIAVNPYDLRFDETITIEISVTSVQHEQVL